MTSSVFRTFLSGAHSTGKTTILNDLKQWINLHVEEEVARDLIREQGLTREEFDPENHSDVFEKLQVDILQRQCEVDWKNIENGTDYISDRGIDALIYVKKYCGEDAMKRVMATKWAQDRITCVRESLVFVIEPHIECIKDDSIRLHPQLNDLVVFNKMLKMLLKELNIEYTVIEMLDRQQRVKAILKKISTVKDSMLKNGTQFAS